MKKHAFTLIELLIVITIIGVIAGLLLPTLSRAREGARRSICANNLRQIGMAVNLYIDEHDFKFPPLEDRSTPTCLYWWDFITPYLNTKDLWHCPSFKFSQLAMGYTSYAYNTHLQDYSTTFYRGIDIDDVKSTSHCIMFTDSSSSNLRRNKAYHVVNEGDIFKPGDRHSGGADVVFVDGHVGWYLQDFLSAQGAEWWNN